MNKLQYLKMNISVFRIMGILLEPINDIRLKSGKYTYLIL